MTSTAASPTSAVSRRGPYRNGVRRREQIVTSASQIFAELGYSAGSIRTIAERVGVSPATLLQHFGSKEGLLMAVLEDWDRRTRDVSAPTHAQGLDFFRHIPRIMTFHLENRGLLELFITMAAEASSPRHPAREFIQQHYADTLDRWGTCLTEAATTGEVKAMSQHEVRNEMRLLIAMLDGIEIQWLLEPTTDLVDLVTTYINTMIERWSN